jgi:hypothetical protein
LFRHLYHERFGAGNEVPLNGWPGNSATVLIVRKALDVVANVIVPIFKGLLAVEQRAVLENGKGAGDVRDLPGLFQATDHQLSTKAEANKPTELLDGLKSP